MKSMHKWFVLASVMVCASGSVACARGGSRDSASESLLAPSSAGDALDAKGGGRPRTGGSGTLTLVMVADANANGLPNWGDSVRFNVSTTATTEPNVSLTCTQNGVVVYGATTGYYASYPWPWTQTMTLSSNAWQGGGASCTAKLYYFSGTSVIDLTSINFQVYP